MFLQASHYFALRPDAHQTNITFKGTAFVNTYLLLELQGQSLFEHLLD